MHLHIDTLLRTLSRVLDAPETCHPAPAASDDVTQGLLRTILERLNTMSDVIDTKLDQAIAATAALSGRVDAQNAKLSAAETARDAAVTELTSTKATLAEVQAQLAAMPTVDTTAQESRLAAEGVKLDGLIASLTAIDAAPVVAAPVTDPAAAPVSPDASASADAPASPSA